VPRRSLAVINAGLEHVVEPGEFDLLVGFSSQLAARSRLMTQRRGSPRA